MIRELLPETIKNERTDFVDYDPVMESLGEMKHMNYYQVLQVAEK